jgi:LPS sulfotransferase NodH
MLEGVDTGLEGKFDFPVVATPPDVVYMLATVPRTGSSFFSHALWRSGCLGAPLEYLNFDPAGPYSFASSAPDLQQRLWRSVLRRRTSPNGVFGFKCFPVQLQALGEHNPALRSALRPSRIVYLTRRDRMAHIVSLARASVSGVWRKEQENALAAPPSYSHEAMDAAERGIEVQAAGWEKMFAGGGIEPLRLCYEDVIARPDEAVRQVAEHLGVALVAGAEVPVPPVARQSGAGARDWATRYERSKTAPA